MRTLQQAGTTAARGRRAGGAAAGRFRRAESNFFAHLLVQYTK